MLQKHLLKWLIQNRIARAIRSVPETGLILASDRGLKRDENQDRIGSLRYFGRDSRVSPFICVALADGMGGLRDGSECAELALASFFDSLVKQAEVPVIDRLDQAVRYANSEVFNSKNGSGGTTLSAILVESHHDMYSVNVGDSRIYVERTDNGIVQFSRVTVDDNLEEAFGGQGRELLQFVGIGKGIRPHVNRLDASVRSIALTSDGIHFIDKALLENIFLNAPEPRSAADRLLALSRWFGGPDNASIAIINPAIGLKNIERFDASYMEFSGLLDNLIVLPLRETRAADEYPQSNSRKSENKKRGVRHARSPSNEGKKKPEQLKIDVEVEGQGPNGSNS